MSVINAICSSICLLALRGRTQQIQIQQIQIFPPYAAYQTSQYGLLCMKVSYLTLCKVPDTTLYYLDDRVVIVCIRTSRLRHVSHMVTEVFSVDAFNLDPITSCSFCSIRFKDACHNIIVVCNFSQTTLVDTRPRGSLDGSDFPIDLSRGIDFYINKQVWE